MSGNHMLVPLSESITVRQTVRYAVQEAIERGAELHFVVGTTYDVNVPEGIREHDQAESLLRRATAWVHEDAEDEEFPIKTMVLGEQDYLFGPRDFAVAFAAYMEDNDIDRIVLDPEYRAGETSILLQSLEHALDEIGVNYTEAPVGRPARHERFSGRSNRNKFIAMFGISYGFYLVLGDPTYLFDIVTGAVTAFLVAITLSHVTFGVPPSILRSPMRTVRFSLYVPYLILEIIKANIAISVVILRPSLPIDPKMTRINARVGSGLPLLALANSITLTPGTLTVRANDQRLVVHTLLGVARDDLFDGRLERAIRFVFYGRDGLTFPTPREREDIAILAGDEK